MFFREQSAALPQVIADENPTPRTTRLSLMGLSLAMVLAWAVSAFSYAAIADLEGIRDGRAMQVTVMYGWWLGALWLTGFAIVCIGGRRESPADVPFIQAIRASRALHRFRGAVVGVVGVTIVLGLALMLLALSALVVTPPAAFLIMVLATALAAVPWIYWKVPPMRRTAGSRLSRNTM